ncbi:MAG: Gfo/Idh/MocA family oxidoreductase [Silicimonas sp.]|nr:Gfo/Idh/MocA family oxidoreductase [Silicimonas sp.]
MTDLSIAVVGAGLVGRRHAELIARHASLAALVDPAPVTADLASALGTRHFATLEDCLDGTSLDGVIVATPNQLHVAHARACIERNLPVLIEKPIADNSDSAAGLVAFAAEKSVPILVGHHRRHNPLIAAARSIIAAGQLGDIVAINGQFWLYKPDDYYSQAWRRQKGAGPVFINLIHDIDLLRHLCGDILAVQAMQSGKTRGFDVEDTAAILLEFESGALGTFSVSDTVVAPWSWEFTAGENPAYPNVATSAYQIGGTRASLSLPDMVVWKHPEARSWWNPIEQSRVPAEDRDALEEQCRHFLKVCGGVPPLVDGAEGLKSLRAIEAIRTAAETGQKVRLDP